MVPPDDDTPDFELIRRMADEEADFAAAREAWACFYVRHHRFLLRVCAADHGYSLGTEEVKDIVQNAFLKAFDGAATFDHSDACEPALQARRTRGWLARIMENLVRDRFRGELEVCIVDESEMERLGPVTEENPDQSQAPESVRLKLVKSGFASLSDTEQTVLRATMFWWRPDQKHQRMPKTALQQLSQQTGKTPENVRQIRLRAVQKLVTFVKENLQNEKAN